jgi:hypothetical protein
MSKMFVSLVYLINKILVIQHVDVLIDISLPKLLL